MRALRPNGTKTQSSILIGFFLVDLLLLYNITPSVTVNVILQLVNVISHLVNVILHLVNVISHLVNVIPETSRVHYI
jgi:hypothetical protein